MNECMEFPETFKEFAKSYGFKDSKEVYTNGSELIPVFRVEQWLEHRQAEILDKISAEIEEMKYPQKASKFDANAAGGKTGHHRQGHLQVGARHRNARHGHYAGALRHFRYHRQ